MQPRWISGQGERGSGTCLFWVLVAHKNSTRLKPRRIGGKVCNSVRELCFPQRSPLTLSLSHSSPLSLTLSLILFVFSFSHFAIAAELVAPLSLERLQKCFSLAFAFLAHRLLSSCPTHSHTAHTLHTHSHTHLCSVSSVVGVNENACN